MLRRSAYAVCTTFQLPLSCASSVPSFIHILLVPSFIHILLVLLTIAGRFCVLLAALLVVAFCFLTLIKSRGVVQGEMSK